MNRRTQRVVKHEQELNSSQRPRLSQRSSARAGAVDSNFDVGELQMVLVKMMKLILNYSSNKLPFKRQDLVEKSLGGNGIMCKRVLHLATNSLNHLYGITIVEVKESKPPKYICVSNFSGTPLAYSDKQKKQITLLFIILSYIFMKGGTVTESGVVQFLKKFGIEPDEDHSHFGQVKVMMELFYKQLYFHKEKFTQEGQNEAIIQLSWGQRAELEFSKKDVLDTVAKLYNKPTICFRQQHCEIYGSLDEQPTTQAEPSQSE